MDWKTIHSLYVLSLSLFFAFFFLFLGPHLWHMKYPRLGVDSDAILATYTTATATWDLSHICDLHRSSWQYQILNTLMRPGIEPTSSWILVGFITAEPLLHALLTSRNLYSTGRGKMTHLKSWKAI